MEDLISRKEALKALRGAEAITRVFGYHNVYDAIIELPSAEPKRGKWRHYEGVLTCMECGAEFYDDIMEYTGDEVPHFCPDCGANMEG